MTEAEAIELLLGYDDEPWHRRWEALAKRSNMKLTYIGVCPRCQMRLEFHQNELSLPDCPECRELQLEYTALINENDRRIAQINRRPAKE